MSDAAARPDAASDGGAAQGQRLRREARREQLLDAAAALVLEHGASALTVERLASWAGVSRALVYQHAADRGDLLFQLYERERAVFENRARDRAPAARDVAGLLRAMHGAYLDAVEERGPLFVRLVGEPSVTGRIEEVRRRQQEATVEFWREQVEGLGVAQAQATAFARCFSAAALASGDLLLSGRPRAQVEQVFYALVDRTLDGLLPEDPHGVSAPATHRRRAAPRR